MDVSTMFVKCENMRVLIVDEGSFASCESLSTTELDIRIVTRDVVDTCKVRRGEKKSANEIRIFGGLDTFFFVD